MDNEPQPAAHDSYAALRFPDFRRLLCGRFLASLGDQMVSVTIAWQVYEWTGKAYALGFIGFLEVMPVILLSLPAGHLSDRMNRRRIVLTMKFMLALCSLLLAAISVWHAPTATRLPFLYGTILLIGIARAFLGPAGSTLITQTVPPEHFSNAATWNSNAWQTASALGPALGGTVIALQKSATPAYVIDFALGLAYLLLIGSIRGKQAERAKGAATLDSLKEGFAFLRQSRLLLATITLDLFAVLLGGATALLPVYAKDILKVGPVGLGWMRAAPSLGAVAMALMLAHLPPMKQAGKTLLWAVAGFGIATVVFGVSKSFPLSLLMLVLLGAFDNISVVVRSTLLLIRVPDAMRGRISAVNSIFVGASNEMGAFESGFAAQWLGPVAAVALGGVGTLLVVLLTTLIWPELRDLKTLQSIEEVPV